MAAKKNHFIWELYLALAATGGRSEPEGRAAIKAFLPGYAGEVDAIVAAGGDVAKLDSTAIESHEERMRQEAHTLEAGVVNDPIRAARAASRRDFSDDDASINASIRRPRSGRLVGSESGSGS